MQIVATINDMALLCLCVFPIPKRFKCSVYKRYSSEVLQPAGTSLASHTDPFEELPFSKMLAQCANIGRPFGLESHPKYSFSAPYPVMGWASSWPSAWAKKCGCEKKVFGMIFIPRQPENQPSSP